MAAGCIVQWQRLHLEPRTAGGQYASTGGGIAVISRLPSLKFLKLSLSLCASTSLLPKDFGQDVRGD